MQVMAAPVSNSQDIAWLHVFMFILGHVFLLVQKSRKIFCTWSMKPDKGLAAAVVVPLGLLSVV
jgi:hypothetical protein